MRKGSNLERGRKRRREKTRILVVTEGTKTEQQYFGLLLQHLKATGVNHWPLKNSGVGRDPGNVLKVALQKRDNDGESFDSIWVVVDVDEHDSLEKCMTDAAKEDVKVVVSNPCFEIWLLWHLRDHRREDSGPALQEILKSCGHKDKSVPATFPVMEYPAATERALAADKDSGTGVVGKNPSSGMHALLSYLLAA